MVKVTIRSQVRRKGKASRAYSKMKGRRPAQKKFQLPKPTARQVKSLSNMAECVKYTGFELVPTPKKLPIQSFYLKLHL